MATISADQRQRAKTAAANAAVAANDMAVVLGAGGVVIATGGVASGVGALAGVVAGGTLAVCSFGAWLIGNRYQRLANDPPRGDFDVLTRSGASVIDERLPAGEPLATVARFAAQQIVLADAIGSLVTSLERCDGASEAGDSASASSQADAVESNARAVVTAGNALAMLAVPVNQAWTATLNTVDWDAVSLEQMQGFFRNAIGNPGTLDGLALEAVKDTVSGLEEPLTDADVSSHPVLTAGEMPARPSEIVSAAFLQQLAALSGEVKDLVIADQA